MPLPLVPSAPPLLTPGYRPRIGLTARDYPRRARIVGAEERLRRRAGSSRRFGAVVVNRPPNRTSDNVPGSSRAVVHVGSCLTGTNQGRAACTVGAMPWRAAGDQHGVMTENPTLDIPVPRGTTADKTGIAVGVGPVDVDAYIDFQCPFCKQFELDSRDIIDRLLDRQMIRFIRHPMNFLDALSTNHYSTRAAAAAAAASDGGRFHEYSYALFQSQPPEGGLGLSDEQLITLGRVVGVADPTFAGEIKAGTYLSWPAYVTARATARGVGGTPSIFVDGIAVAARADLVVAAVQRAGS